ncbi:CARDB domain-containing protein [Limnoglobus roseus]|uniref:DUF11 domain-containing protein n=1 Tax=Limnoglobus roseus TaxID=2598579 RepID=A0A5C1AA64_9BACT|nr:CARDB domain-containing protein [Limnoglobus roseus]QEL13938.1 hypothetical protein PX52LOC_00798 [Limnoglobus roseus]
MRIRKFWVALPTLAVGALGSTTMTSWLGAQEPGQYGYYPSKVSPSQPGLVPGTAAPAPVPATTGAPTVNGQPVNWAPPKPKLTSPVTAGPTPDMVQVPVRQVSGTRPDASAVRQAGGSEPIAISPPKLAADPIIATPIVTPPLTVLPTAVPAPGPVGSPLPPPKLSVESSLPDIKPEPRPLTFTPPAAAGPTMLKPPPAPPALSTAPVPATLPAVPTTLAGAANPAPTSFPIAGLATRSTPSVVLEEVAPESVSVNQPLTYELVVRNTGSTAVANVRVEDEPSAGAKYMSSEPAAEQAAGKLVWQLGTLDAGAEKRIKVTIKPADEGEVRSRAVLSFSAATEARVKVTRPKINLAMSAVEASRVGDEIAFTIRVSNTGSGAASKMQLQANLSDGLNHAQGSVIETDLANLPAGESRTLTLRTLATKSGSQTCSLSVVADGNPAETSKATVAVVEPMLSAKVTGPGKCLVRSEPEFKIELSNPGSAATEPVQAWASIPEGFEFVSATDSGTFNGTNRTVAWKLSNLAVGGKKEVAIKLRATGIVDGSVKVQAQASSAEVPETGVTPASARVARTIEAKAEGAIKAEGVAALRFEVLDVEDPVEVGKEAVYEIKVVNQGTAPCTNVQVIATLADGTSATGANGPTQARGQGQQVTFDALATLETKKEAVFKVKVKGGTAGDQRFRVQLVCDQIKTPIAKEESTRFYKD